MKRTNHAEGILGLRMIPGANAKQRFKSGAFGSFQFAVNIRDENNFFWRTLQGPRNPFVAEGSIFGPMVVSKYADRNRLRSPTAVWAKRNFWAKRFRRRKWRSFYSVLASACMQVSHHQILRCVARHSHIPPPRSCPEVISVRSICDHVRSANQCRP